MIDYIRKAMELADGFDLTEDQLTLPSGHYFMVCCNDVIRPWMLDALAAQLVRQVDALDEYWFDNDKYCGSVVDSLGSSVGFSESPTDEPYDRTMNTIKAIVDSGVLE